MFKTELAETKQSALILTNSFGKLYKLLKDFLEKRNIEVFTGRAKKAEFGKFDYIFFIDPSFEIFKKIVPNLKKALVIFSSESPDLHKSIFFLKKRKIQGVKIAGVSRINIRQHLERALWFFFSKSNEIYLPASLEKKEEKKVYFRFDLSFLSYKKLFGLLIFLFFFYNLVVWSFLALSFYFSFQELKGKNSNFLRAKSFYKLSERMYSVTKPIYHFFFLGSRADRLIGSGKVFLKLIEQKEFFKKSLPKFFSFATKPVITSRELEEEKELVKAFKREISQVKDEVRFLQEALPKFLFSKEKKEKLQKAQEIASIAEEFFEKYELIFPVEKKKKYLILFANNMELRPGGGFIGSFAILKTRPLGIEEIKVYDVYDADGQLKFHFEPPEPIKRYLKQPHWFLRDSNFSPDLIENYEVAKKFLEYELGEKDFSGIILITTSAVEEILKVFGEVYLPDYGEKINAQNFYVKAQFYSQKNFFPGALNKKRFLFSLLNQLIVEAERVDPIALAGALKSSLDQKYIALYFEDKRLQEFFDRHYWSGRMIKPKCLSSQVKSCVLDYIFPVDANLGVNKANFYVKKKVIVQLSVQKDGSIKVDFSYTLRNDSPSEVFPGGTYKNYFRLFLLKDIKPLSFSLGEKKLDFKIKPYISFVNLQNLVFSDYFLIVKPKESLTLKYVWENRKKLKEGSNFYQLIVQKQLGGINYDFTLKIVLPKNVYLVNQNFTPLVKEGSIIYNTYLSSDKVFFLELVKE